MSQSESEELSFAQVEDTLRSWLGQKVRIFVGPEGAPDGGSGVAWCVAGGILGVSDQGAQWDSEDRREGQSRGAVAYALGTAGEDFVIYRSFFKNARWVSREHGFFVIEMTGGELGCKLETETEEEDA